jgi:uncharacterized protein (TIGR02453 family)
MAFFQPDFIQFFIDLAPNNHKAWFDEYRQRYEQMVKRPFADFVNQMIHRMASIDVRYKELEPKDCIFRINRDVRFSKDKSPYKMMCSAVIAPGGKKSKAIDGFYLELGPEHVRVYGGVYEVDKLAIEQIRFGIAERLEEFQQLYQSEEFASVYGQILGEKHKRLPKELHAFAEKEQLLYNKQWYFYTEFEPDVLLQDDLDELILKCYLAGRDVQQFMSTCIHSTL